MPKINMLPYIKPDAALGAVIGTDTVQVSEMLKRLWNYIRSHDLKIAYKDYKG